MSAPGVSCSHRAPIASPGAAGENGRVPSWGSFSYAFGPVVAVVAVLVLALVLRWASRRGGSVVAPPPRPGPPEDYGMLVPVAAPATHEEAGRIGRRLAAGGVPATVATTTDGLRVLVWPGNEAAASRLLASPGDAPSADPPSGDGAPGDQE
jgi:hypothetical protein